MKKRVNTNKKIIEPEMSVYELSQLMMKQFERVYEKFEDSDNKFIEFKSETITNLNLINTKVSRTAEEVEKIDSKIDKINDKSNNTFYLGQELNRLEQRVIKL